MICYEIRDMKKMAPWITALRLRSLALSVSSVIMGSFLAFNQGFLNNKVLVGTFLVTVFLQTLSNLANEYGDTIHGVDNDNRLGPKRGVQSGHISLTQMKRAIFLVVVLALASGIWLVWEGTRGLSSSALWILLAIGLLAILAALKYTVGKNPYGYHGLGDVAVFIFFGIVAVTGTFYLHTHLVPRWEFLPAATMGFFAVSVLNMNNLRDYENDKNHGKRSLVVLMGVRSGKLYQVAILISGWLCSILYASIYFRNPWQFFFVLTLPFYLKNLHRVFNCKHLSELDSELKRLSIATLFFSLTFGIGLLL